MAMKNYYIMSGDTAVAKWENSELTVLNEALLPLYLRRVNNADMWLETRAIDSHRANSRLLKKALRLKEKDDISTVIHVNGATITDNYWIKPLDSDLIYDDVKFSDDYFARLALKGTYDSFNRAANSKHSRTPELTNIGSFEKCWRLIDGKWWMYKSANHDEMFSELFIARIGATLGMNMAVYERGDRCVKTLDFTNAAEVNFEPASTFMDDNDDYEDVVAKLQEICPQAIPDYVRMIFLDTIVANPDRHTANFGLLRDTPKAPKKSDLLIRLFNELIEHHPEYKEYLPEVNEEVIRNTIAALHMRVRTDDIVGLIMSRYGMIE